MTTKTGLDFNLEYHNSQYYIESQYYTQLCLPQKGYAIRVT